MADPLGADALAALVNELNITKHEPKLQAANITTLRQLKALDDDGLSALGLPEGPTVRLREKLKAVAAVPVVTPPKRRRRRRARRPRRRATTTARSAATGPATGARTARASTSSAPFVFSSGGLKP